MKGIESRRRTWMLLSIALLLALYLGSYLAFRSLNAQVWEKDGMTYVIFPENFKAIYYLYRPMTYIDGALTGMRFHIGPHR